MSNPGALAKLRAKVEVSRAELLEVTRQSGTGPGKRLQPVRAVAAVPVSCSRVEQELAGACKDHMKEPEKPAPR